MSETATQPTNQVFSAKTWLRTPPQDLGAEQATLGSILIKPEGVAEVLDILIPEDFYAEKHRRIYKTMLQLYEKNEPIDAVSLTTILKETNQLDNIGGARYLAELINTVPTAANLKYYAETVKKKSALRRLIQSADQIAEMGYREDDELDSIFDKAAHAILEVGRFSKQTFIRLKDTLAEAWERFDHLHKSGGPTLRGTPTGFRDLDSRLAGLQKSDLIIIAGRPSTGKTSLALDIARQVACQQNKSVIIFTLEMSAQQLVDRVIAAEARIDAWKLRTGRLSRDEEFVSIRDALDRLATARIFIDDQPANNVIKMKAVARKIQMEYGLDLIVVDYLQLMLPKKERDSMVQQVTEISRSLKAMARELEVPTIAISQLSRAVEQRGGRPRLSDLRDSGSIEQDADVVLFIHREDKLNSDKAPRNIAEIIIAKHRNGPTGEFQLYFDEEKVSFATIEKSDFGNF